MDQLVYWIWLSLACTPGSYSFADLISKFPDAEAIYDATDRQIRSAINPKISDCSALYDKDLTKAEEIYNFCKTKGVGIVTYNDDDFPYLLRRIPNPPVLLYYRGTIPKLKGNFKCAIVGTRTISSYGRKNAFAISYDFAFFRGIVVSGMAKGIDGIALAAAIEAGGSVIAVLGSGIDVCYPSEHLTLAREIVKHGVIFTEYPPGTKPLRRNFPTRNRLISGICDATLVVEAGAESGALITGYRALDQGRILFAVPGRVDNDASNGTNYLIKRGARVCMDVYDIMEDFHPPYVPGVFDVQNYKELKRPKNYMDVLAKYRVVCNVPDDPVFTPSGRKMKPQDQTLPEPPNEKAESASEKEKIPYESIEPPSPVVKEKKPTTFPYKAEQYVLYKDIPFEGDIAIEDLVNEKRDLKKVMNMLLKLELCEFVEILPGDRVRRKFHG